MAGIGGAIKGRKGGLLGALKKKKSKGTLQQASGSAKSGVLAKKSTTKKKLDPKAIAARKQRSKFFKRGGK